MLPLKDVCSCVFLKRLFSTTFVQTTEVVEKNSGDHSQEQRKRERERGERETESRALLKERSLCGRDRESRSVLNALPQPIGCLRHSTSWETECIRPPKKNNRGISYVR